VTPGSIQNRAIDPPSQLSARGERSRGTLAVAHDDVGDRPSRPLGPQDPVLPAAWGRFSAEIAQAEAEGVPLLVWPGADGRPRTQHLRQGPYEIGRDPRSSIALTWDGKVSRIHAQLERAGEYWTVRDDGLSKNGTVLNGVQLSTRARLSHQDQILVGRCRLTFLEARQAAQTVTETQEDEIRALPDFTNRQRDVLLELGRCYFQEDKWEATSIREIAEALSLTTSAVKKHLKRMYDDCGIESGEKNMALLQLVVRRGLLAPRDY